jgi:hypothetical protein
MTRTVHSPWQLAVFATRPDVPLDCRAHTLRAHVAGMSPGFRRAVRVILNMIADDQAALKTQRN